MKKTLTFSVGAMMLASTAFAGGLDRSGQSMNILFEKGTYAELSFAMVKPKASGVGNAPFATVITNVANDYSMTALGFKSDVNDKLSYALIIDQPFGADINYAAGPSWFGGTSAKISSQAITTMLRYKLSDRFSVYGGLRAQKTSADVTLSGFAYGGASGQVMNFASDMGLGYSVGAAFEKPEIALRVALTYNSKIKHEFATTETGPLPGTGVTPVETPESLNLEFQSGVAANTLVFGSIRYAKWGNFSVIPPNLGSDLSSLGDTTTYNIGVGRKFNDKLSGSISVSYEKEGNPLVSPLAPTNGKLGIGAGVKYTIDNVEISGGVSYTKLGDANPQTANTGRASFTDNSALAFGLKIGYRF